MAILAFRGINNDRALYESNKRRYASEQCKRLFDELNELFTTVENKILQKVDTLPDQVKDSLVSALLRDSPIGVAAIIKSEEHWQIISEQMLFFSTSAHHSLEKKKVISSQFYPLGNQFEYQEKNYLKAISFYQEKLPHFKTFSDSINTLITLARLNVKNGSLLEALAHYALLEEKFGGYYFQSELPADLLAKIEAAHLFAKMGKDSLQIQKRIEINNGLLAKKWYVSKDIFDVFTQRLDEIDSNLMSDEGLSSPSLTTLDSLITKRSELLQQTIIIHRFLHQLQANIIDFNPMGNSVFRKSWFDISAKKELFISRIDLGSNKQVYVLYDADSMLINHVKPKISILIDSTDFEIAIWSDYDRNPEQITNTASIALTEIRFPRSLYPWTIHLSYLPKTLWGSIKDVGRGIYFFLFLFICLILIGGSIFSIYIIRREYALQQLKSKFITNVSHEIKSPLTSIKQITELMLNDRVVKEDEKKFLRIMQEEGENLIAMVSNLLDLNALDKGMGSLQITTMDIQSLIKSVIDHYQSKLFDKKIKFNLHCQEKLPNVQADKEAIKQALKNLIDNAIKYSGDSKVIDIHISHSAHIIEIVIQDYGIGIPQKSIPYIFDRFYRVPYEENNNIKGNGLGLALVKQIIDRHRGEIDVESELNEGTTFHFSLPINHD